MRNHKIKMIRTDDGRQIWYPDDHELKDFKNIESIIIEETMTKAEFDKAFDIYPNGMVVPK